MTTGRDLLTFYHTLLCFLALLFSITFIYILYIRYTIIYSNFCIVYIFCINLKQYVLVYAKIFLNPIGCQKSIRDNTRYLSTHSLPTKLI